MAAWLNLRPPAWWPWVGVRSDPYCKQVAAIRCPLLEPAGLEVIMVVMARWLGSRVVSVLDSGSV